MKNGRLNTLWCLPAVFFLQNLNLICRVRKKICGLDETLYLGISIDPPITL
jgi:hypothetical protein